LRRKRRQRPKEGGIDDGLRLVPRRQGLAGDVVPAHALSRGDPHQLPGQRFAIGKDPEFLIHEVSEPVRERCFAKLHPPMDLVGQEAAKCAQVLKPDLQIETDGFLLHVELRDGGGEHGLGTDDGVGAHRQGQQADKQSQPDAPMLNERLPCQRA
jgi:hypothetical protein